MHFQFAPDILSRLGEELTPNPDQGIIELVKNAYDADATECTVTFLNTEKKGGSIIIADDGMGMNQDDISKGWLVLGRSQKAMDKRTKLGRLPVGDKGLGRLAALRLGSSIILCSRSKQEPGVEYSLTINWRDFEQVDTVEEVVLTINSSPTDKNHGTEIRIENVNRKFGRRELKRLAKDMLLLADPFATKVSFHPRLIASSFPDLEKKVNQAFFKDAEYHLKATLNSDGSASAAVFDWKEDLLYRADHDQLSGSKYETVSAEFELWIFLLNPQNFSAKQASFPEVRDWLEKVGNVHLYHRGMRVQPYGDGRNDWLGINLARARNPEAHPSTKTVIGRVVVEDIHNQLQQTTNRLGFRENEAFEELKRFATDVLNWLHKERLKEGENKRQTVKQESISQVRKVREQIESEIERDINPQYRGQVLEILQRYEQAQEQQVKALREDLQLYRSLATAGTTAAVFAHESNKPITMISKIAKRIEKKGKELLPKQYANSLKSPVDQLYGISKSWKTFATFPLELLRRNKRRSGVVYVDDVIKNILALFQDLFQDAKIKVKSPKSNEELSIRGSVALLEAILTNLLTNTLNVLTVEGGRLENRLVVISTKKVAHVVRITVSDNGGGIEGIELDEIWLPGQTTKPGGTGLGLTIVKDSVTDMGGKVQAIPKGELGGAEFIVELPLVGGTGK